MNDRAITLFCPVWGQHFHDLLEQYALPSLMLPGNLPKLGLDRIYVDVMGVHHEWENTQRVFREQLHGLPVEIRQIGMPRADRNIADGIRDCMNACIQRQTRMLLAMPDTIIGPGSLANIFNYAKGKPVCVAAAHVRVNEDRFFADFPHWKLWPFNRDLCRAAFQIDAVNICDTNKDNVTDVGAIAWTQINDDTRLMLHYVPTVYLAWFTQSDVNWWQQVNEKGFFDFGKWDHLWPTLLMNERRFRVVGSTNIFFAVELESAQRSNSLHPRPGTAGNELTNERNPHNDACGSFLIEVRT